MRFYPVNLNIEEKLCIVIGGGKVAERKIKTILSCGGKVKIISPGLSPLLSKMAKEADIEYIESGYRSGMIKGGYLVFACTSDRGVNSRISQEARSLGILVNVCDSAKESTFILPAVLRKGAIDVAVSTSGISPLRAVKIRDKLKEKFNEFVINRNKS